MTDSRAYAEAALDPDLPVVDPHHHLWVGPKSHNQGSRYMIGDLQRDTGSGHNIVKTVYIEAKEGYRTYGPELSKPVGETEFVVSQRPDNGLVAGIVGKVDLRAGVAVGEILDQHVAAGQGSFKGVRFSVGYDEHDDVPNTSSQPGPRVLLGEQFRIGLEELAKRGLSFESWCYFHQLPELAVVADQHPSLSIIVNHLGGPASIGRYRDRRREVVDQWLRHLESLSGYPNVFLKLGGIGMHHFAHPDLPPLGTRVSSDEIAHAWEKEIAAAIAVFGADRCMFESNFPVDRPLADYVVLWNSFKRMAASYDNTQRVALFSGTALRAYKL